MDYEYQSICSKRPNSGKRNRRRPVLYIAVVPLIIAVTLLVCGQLVMDHATRTGNFTINPAHCIDCADDKQCSLGDANIAAPNGESNHWAPAEYVELTKDMVGKELKEGERYKVTQDLTLDGRPGGTAGFIANNNVIYVAKGATLTCYGADAKGFTGGKPGIELTEGRTLALLGEGKVFARGGDLAYGLDGENGASGGWERNGDGDLYWGGAGGAGGRGGGGGGAGIGTAGSDGGEGGKASGVNRVKEKRGNETNGQDGNNAIDPKAPSKSGSVTIAGELAVEAIGGWPPETSDPAKGGSQGSAKKDMWWPTKYLPGGGGGGGSGGSGGQANGIGPGGCGGSGGGGGGQGGAIWRAVPIIDAESDSAPMGAGGQGGFPAFGLDTGTGIGKDGGGGRTTESGHSGGWGGKSSQREAMKSFLIDKADLVVWFSSNAQPLTMNTWISKASIVEFDRRKMNFSGKRLTMVTAEQDFAKVKNNAGWYVNNTISLNGGTAGDATEVSFFSIIDLTKADALKEQLERTAKSAKKDGFRFAGFALGKGFESDKLLYDAKTGQMNQELLSEKGIIRQNSRSEWVWATGKNVPIVAQWEPIEDTYSITYDPHGGSFVDMKTGAAVSEPTYTDNSYKKTVFTPLWNNNGIGVYKLVKPKDAADDVQLLGWAQYFNSQGKPIKLYLPGNKVKRNSFATGDKVVLYAVWGTKSNLEEWTDVIAPSEE